MNNQTNKDMAAKIFRINYKSDFILTLHSDAGWLTPFCIKFWTGVPSQAFYAGWDGTTYTHCSYDPAEPTKLVIQFDDHHLPIGDLKFQVAYHFTVDDFPNDTEDEVINPANVTTEIDGHEYQVMLDFTGETAPEIQFSLPAYANEAQRIANEQQRIANEEQRIADEQARIDNETLRISAEQTRQDNEAQRIRNEQTRISQEEARVREFATLKHDSQEATTAANDAATLANQKAQLANEKAQLAADKAALAQAAATLANEKAQLAADKAALASAAAQLADDKAALAQQKAEYAQTQGDYAKTQGDYAKNEIDGAKGEYPSLNARFNHVDEISMYFEDEVTPANPQLINEYEACLARAYQAIADLLVVKDLASDSAAQARQAASEALAAIDAVMNATHDAERATAAANTAAQYASEQADYARRMAEKLENTGVFFEEAPLT